MARNPFVPARIRCALLLNFQITFSVPLYFQVTTNASAMIAGVYLIPIAAGALTGGLAAGLIIRK